MAPTSASTALQAPTTTSINMYSKWDSIDDSDSEDEKERKKNRPMDAVMERNKSSQRREDDMRLAEHFKSRMSQYCGKEKPEAALRPEDYEMVSRFIGVCDRGFVENATNSHRYNDILAFTARYKAELCTEVMADRMCELYCAMQNACHNLKDESDPLAVDNKKLMEAINTLEACRVHENAAAFYEMVCTPSKSDRAMLLAKNYAAMEFGKHAMMRHVLPSQYARGWFTEEERKYADLVADGGAPPRGSSRVPEPERSKFWDMDPEDWAILAFTIRAFLVSVGLALGFYLTVFTDRDVMATFPLFKYTRLGPRFGYGPPKEDADLDAAVAGADEL
jgi:hypothetical protein